MTRHASKTEPRFASVGWGTWAVLTLLAIWPGILLVDPVISDTANAAIPIVTGVCLAAIAAGVVTAILNSVLQRRAERLRRSTRKSH
jgi:ABC-type Co2+ transport system permease subunit